MKQGQRKDVMESVAPNRVIPGPGYAAIEVPGADTDNPRLSWWTRRALDIRLKTMANTPPPPAWNYTALSVAFSFITVLVLVGGLIFGGAWYLGYQARQIDELQDKIKATDTKAEDARKALYVNQSEEEPPKETKKK